MNTEIWKDVEGYEGIYQVSNKGNVRSLDRYVNHPTSGSLSLKGKLMSASVRNNGYSGISLIKNGRERNFSVHRLIAESFIPNPEGKPQVNHKNGVKTDNRLENLEWATKSENAIHSYKNNLSHKGSAHYNSKLTEQKVSAIKRLLRIYPETNRYALAERVGVTNGVIYQIINNTTWSHVD